MAKFFKQCGGCKRHIPSSLGLCQKCEADILKETGRRRRYDGRPIENESPDKPPVFISHGPFSYGTGGGTRVIRCGSEMS